MGLRIAKLISWHYLNGREAVREDVPLGKVYVVDLNTRCKATVHCTDGEMADFDAEMIKVVGEDGWLPTEILDIEGEVNH